MVQCEKTGSDRLPKLNIGWSQCSITPNGPALMEGQMYTRVSRYVHDPVTATALVLDNGQEQAVFVSMDMTEVPGHAMGRLKKALEKWPGIPFEKISFNVTHTHNSAAFYKDFLREGNEKIYDKDILPKLDSPENMIWGEAGQAFLVEKITDLIVSAWENRKPGGISYAHDYAVVAFNRRPQFLRENGLESVMYGNCAKDDFVRFESGVDPSVELLYTWDEKGDVTGVVCNAPCPSQVHELHCYITADYWAPARDAIREKLKRNVYVLPLCGAAGDLSPVDLVAISKTNGYALEKWGGQTCEVFRDFDMTLLCQSIGDRISEAVVRGYRYARNYISYRPVFKHEVLDLSLPIRQVSGEEYRLAMEEVKAIHRKFSREKPMEMPDLVKAFEPQGVILRYRQQQESACYSCRCHILRIGNIAIATNPFELYHEFGLRIKARAEAEQVFIVQLANGNGGYLPTEAAVNGGSYSAKPASTVCGPEGGNILVEKTLEAFAQLWKI